MDILPLISVVVFTVLMAMMGIQKMRYQILEMEAAVEKQVKEGFGVGMAKKHISPGGPQMVVLAVLAEAESLLFFITNQ